MHPLYHNTFLLFCSFLIVFVDFEWIFQCSILENTVALTHKAWRDRNKMSCVIVSAGAPYGDVQQISVNWCLRKHPNFSSPPLPRFLPFVLHHLSFPQMLQRSRKQRRPLLLPSPPSPRRSKTKSNPVKAKRSVRRIPQETQFYKRGPLPSPREGHQFLFVCHLFVWQWFSHVGGREGGVSSMKFFGSS